MVITGASMGMGELLAYQYARLGANVVITARSEDKLKEVDLTKIISLVTFVYSHWGYAAKIGVCDKLSFAANHLIGVFRQQLIRSVVRVIRYVTPL